MHHLSQTQEGPSKSNNGRHQKPVIVTADKHFHTFAIAALPDLQEHCIHASSLRHTEELQELFGDDLLLFIDIDSYGIASLISFMKRHEPPPEITVIGLSDCSELNLVVSYLKSGINGYFLKNEMSAELIVQTLMTLQGNRFPLSVIVTQKIIQSLIGTQKNNYASLLSHREQQILHRLVNGGSYKIIGYELNISLETVRHHIKNIYKKLGVNSKGEVIAKMMKTPNQRPPFMG
jgi:DNA-binding NarL/FixJ family response regulator